MADAQLSIRIVFKAGSGQAKNPEEEYEIAVPEFERLATEIQAKKPGTPVPAHMFGVYTVSRFSSVANKTIQTRLLIRFDDVLYIG